jgi:hypothetical protein
MDLDMEQYITTEETELSPAVVVTTVLLVAVFALGIVYQLVGSLL